MSATRFDLVSPLLPKASTRNADIILVASSGNNSANLDLNPRYPNRYDIDNIVAVAYTTRNDTLGSLSNYGTTSVDLAAPGAEMYSTFFASDSSYLGGGFLQGTSFAHRMSQARLL